MKYRRLTKEQLEELHPEFTKFLASQSIDVKEWNEIKENKPQVAEEELDVFSDLVWEEVLSNAEFLEHISPQTMNLFHLQKEKMSVISIIVGDDKIDITSETGYKWLQNNLLDESIKFFTADKTYGESANQDKFKLIESGAVITKGDLYLYFDKLVHSGE